MTCVACGYVPALGESVYAFLRCAHVLCDACHIAHAREACPSPECAPVLNRAGRCVSCDQPRGSNPDRCAVCARAREQESA